MLDRLDLVAGSVSVSRTLSEVGRLEINDTKTSAGRRLITLPDFAIAGLKRHRERMFAEGHLAAPPLTISGQTLPGPLVFCAPEGGPIFKHNLLARSFRPLLAKAGLPSIRFHDLRHTAATLLLTPNEHRRLPRNASATQRFQRLWTSTATYFPAFSETLRQSSMTCSRTLALPTKRL